MQGKLNPGSRSLGRFSFKALGAAEYLLLGVVGALVILAGFALFQSFSAQQRSTGAFSGWYEDKAGYDEVMAIQKQTRQPVMVYFYADWCPHCKRFKAQVLSDRKMQKFVKEYAHVRIAPDNGQPEKDLMADFEAKGYPSYFVVLPDGRRFPIETYRELPGGKGRLKTPDEFINSVLTVVEKQ